MEEKPYRGAKIPSEENHIRIQRTVCDICDAGCNIDAYVKDGRVIKVTGCKNPAYGNGYLCARGHANRPYIYHEDRIRTPLRRVGERGQGIFEAISWEEALDEVARRLLECKKKCDPSSVFFYGGSREWEMAALQRMAYGFGSVNCTGNSYVRRAAAHLAANVAAGCPCHADIEHSGVVLMWGCNPYNKGNTVINPVLTQKRGAKVIVIDPRVTVSTYHLADMHLQLRPGTDAALVHGLARIFVERGWVNKSYIAEHVQGFFDYRAYISDFTPERVQELTGISAAQLEAAAHMIMNNGPMSVMISDDAFAEMHGGVQTRRAIEALCAITGNYDVRGGMLPDLRPGAQQEVLREFVAEVEPESMHTPVGAHRYPLYAHFSNYAQISDLARQIRQGTPYPIRALCAFGLNLNAFPNDAGWETALESLDFFVDVDLFMTRTAKFADIILPACSSFERENIRVTADSRIYETPPVIAPVGLARPDLDIICGLAGRLVPEDRLLCSGSAYLYEYWLSQMDLSLDILRQARAPMKMEHEIYRPGSYTESGYHTASGRYELKSALLETIGQNPLPVYVPLCGAQERYHYPFVMSVGNRHPLSYHSRTCRIAWLHALQPTWGIEMHPDDAMALGIAEGEKVELHTLRGDLQVLAHLTQTVHRGMVTVTTDQEEVDIFSALSEDDVDPCSGVSALRTMRCSLSKL